MNIQTSFVVAALLALAACTNTSSSPAPATSGAVAAPATAGTTGGAAPGATAACTEEQFVACESGEACATRQGNLVNPRPCFDRAADACATLSCAHGCNIHQGAPNQILCALNASGSSHMKRCGGYSNWGCPENMRCDGMDPTRDDTVTCVQGGRQPSPAASPRLVCDTRQEPPFDGLEFSALNASPTYRRRAGETRVVSQPPVRFGPFGRRPPRVGRSRAGARAVAGVRLRRCAPPAESASSWTLLRERRAVPGGAVSRTLPASGGFLADSRRAAPSAARPPVWSCRRRGSRSSLSDSPLRARRSRRRA